MQFQLRRDAPTSALRLNISSYGWGRTPPTDGTENPWRDSVEHFPLQAPPLHIDSLLRLLRKSHYDYATELFFGFVGGGLAIGVFERNSVARVVIIGNSHFLVA